MHVAVRQIPRSYVGEFIKLALDDSPTKRYGPKVQLAGMHHNPTPGPSGSEFLYGHVWVTISWLVKHSQWGCIGMPLLALMYVRQKDLQILEGIGKAPWKFRTKLELAAELVEWWKQHIRCRRNQQVRAHRSSGVRVSIMAVASVLTAFKA